MALTDTQQKIIDQEKKRKKAAQQKAASSNSSVGAGSLKLGTAASQLSPLELAKRDGATRTTVRNKVTNAKQSKAAINTKQSIQNNRKKQEDRKTARSKLVLSEADSKLSPLSQKGILDAKLSWEEANKVGDQARMDKAHRDAEKIRSRYGYSGGPTGAEYIQGPSPSEKDKATLNQPGLQALLSALTLGDKDRAEEIRKAKGFQAVDHSVRTDGEGRTIFTQTREEREKAGEQFLSALEAAGKGAVGSLLSVHETANQAMRNYNRDRWGRNLQANANQTKDKALAEASRKVLEGADIVDPMLPGQRLLRESREAQGKALEGKTGLSALLTKAGISGAQMIPGIAASFIPGVGPAVGATLLGAQAAGAKMGELNEQSSNARMLSYMLGGDPKDYGEVTPGQAFGRGLISGGIEGLTERIPIGNLLKIVKGAGGASALANVAKQAGIEAGEESISYVLNHAADVAAQDPNAQFSLQDLLESAAVGAISGGGFGAVGSVIGSKPTKTKPPARTSQDILLEVAGIKPSEAPPEAPEDVSHATQQETQVETGTPVRGQEEPETAQRTREQLEQSVQAVIDRARQAHEAGTLDETAYQGFRQEILALQEEAAAITQQERQEAGQVSRNFGQAESHIDNRTAADVSARNVKAFQFDHPQLHQYFAEAAQALKTDAEYSFASQRAERGAGTIVQRSEQLARAEGLGLTRQEIVAACDAIINDKGQENYAAAKKVELILDEMLSKGYVPNDGGFDSRVEANQGYIQAKNAIPGGVTGADRYVRDNALALDLGEVTEEKLREEFEAMGAMSKGGAGEFARWQAESGSFHPVNQEAAAVTAENRGRAQTEIPTRNLQGRLTSKTISTFANANILPNEMVLAVENDLVAGAYSRIAYTDPQALQDAEDIITERGYQGAKEYWLTESAQGRVSKANSVLGIALINHAANSPNLHMDAMDLLSRYADYAKDAGQALQAMNLINKLTPQGQLYTLVKAVEFMEDRANQNGQEAEVELNPDLVEGFLSAETQEERNEIKKEIIKDVAAQLPNTWRNRFDAWRYLAMLGNPRTHIRNAFGNLGFYPIRTAKNVVGAGMEKLFRVEERTKSVLNRFDAEDRARILAAKNEFAEVKDIILSGGKFQDDYSLINQARNPFQSDNPLLNAIGSGVNWLSEKNAKALDKGDELFSKPAYISSLAGYLKANGMTAEAYMNLDAEAPAKAKAREYAVREAQKATYRDLNAFSEAMSKIGQMQHSDNRFVRGASYVVEGILPFKKTPANILMRGLEYSPVGLAVGAKHGIDAKRWSMKSAKAEEIGRELTKAEQVILERQKSPAQVIDELAAGLTGTALTALGALLGYLGYITGGASGDDKQDDFLDLQGHQNYAVEVGDRSFTLDWLAPEALPFFVGVEFQKFIAGLKGGEVEASDWLNPILRIADPMLEMSMLQGLNETLDATGSDFPLPAAVSTAATSYLTQFLPTILGQIERTGETVRESTYVDPDSSVPKGMQYLLGNIGNKVPGWEYQQVEYVDSWGRKEETGNPLIRAMNNFLNPAYTSRLTTTEVDAELQRLYDGDYPAVFPGQFDKTLEITTNQAAKEKRVLSAAERKKAQQTRGQTAMEILSAAMATDVYRSMSDGEKAKFVESVHEYSKAVARIEAGEDPEHYDSWVDKVSEYEKETDGAKADFFIARNKKNQIDSDDSKEDGEKAWEFETWVDGQAHLTDSQRSFLKDNLKIWGFHPASSAKYHKGVEAGRSLETIRLASDVAGRADAEFGDGNDSMKQGELYQAIKALGLSDGESAELYEQAKPSNWKATWYTSKRE